MNNEESKSLVRNLALAAGLIFIFIIIPLFLGLGKGGFEYTIAPTGTTTFNFQLFSFIFYVILGPVFLIGIFFLFFIEIVIKKGDERYGSSLIFNSPGETPAPPLSYFKGWKGMLKLTILSIILFSIIGLWASYTNQTFTGVGTLQQFTALDNIIFSNALVPPVENLGAFFFFVFFLLFLRAFARKVNMSKGAFIGLSIILCIILFAFYGYVLHQLIYGFNEVALITVIFFWGIGGLISILTGSFIPFLIMHIMNNLFFDLGKLFAMDIITIGTVIFIIGLVASYILLFVRGKKTKN